MDYLEEVWESVKRFFRVNPGVKLSSLLLAILLWLYVIASNAYTYQLEVPLRVVNIRPDLTLAQELPNSVTARFRGTGITYFKTVLSSAYSEFVLRLDARRVEGTTDFYLQSYVGNHPDNFVTPRGLDLELVEIVQPEVVSLQLESVEERMVPVRPRIQLTTQPGYALVGELEIMPDSVKLRGPANLVGQVDSLETEPEEVLGADDPVSGTVSLHIEHPGLVQLSVHQIRYQADIQPISERRMNDIPVEIRNAPDRLAVTAAPSTVSLTLEGGTEYIFDLKPADLSVYIDFPSQWNPDEDYYVPRVRMPEDVLRWRNMTPARIELVVRKE